MLKVLKHFSLFYKRATITFFKISLCMSIYDWVSKSDNILIFGFTELLAVERPPLPPPHFPERRNRPHPHLFYIHPSQPSPGKHNDFLLGNGNYKMTSSEEREGEAGKRGGQEGGSEREIRGKKEASRKAQLRKLQSDGRCRKTRRGELH